MAKDEAQLLAMGLRIKELRESHGYKQQWIADQIGVQLRTYQFWQQGKIAPEQENLEKLAELFEVSPTYILRGETPDPFRSSGGQLDRIEEMLNRILSDDPESINSRVATIADQISRIVAGRLVLDAASQRRRQETAAPKRRSQKPQP